MTPTEQDKELREQLVETILSILGITDRSSGNRPEQIATLEQEIVSYITSLMKELVAGAKPGYDMVKNSKRDEAINEFEQNLLKALEEV